MITETFTVVSDSLNTYYNQGLEKELLDTAKEGSCILYLWQNDKTVVIGKNQDAFNECRVAQLEADGGKLARRLSGGGAVFHDKGNLNYTFILRREDYDDKLQQSVIIHALKRLGLNAYASGRNDLLIDGKKFSGTAYYKTVKGCMHHGTLLVNGDKALMAHYLNVKQDKLEKHGVASVRSRVVNLKELLPTLSIDELKAALIESFDRVYGLTSRKLDSLPECSENESFFEDCKWRYGRSIESTIEAHKRFEYGNVSFKLLVNDGVILDAMLCTDALDFDDADELSNRLKNEPWTADTLRSILSENEREKEMSAWLIKEFFYV